MVGVNRPAFFRTPLRPSERPAPDPGQPAQGETIYHAWLLDVRRRYGRDRLADENFEPGPAATFAAFQQRREQAGRVA